MNRRLSPKPARILFTFVLVAVLVPLAAPPATAATFVVNSTGDAGDTNPGNGACRSNPMGAPICTLRAAIQETNALAGTDTINFAIPGTGPHTISPATPLPTITGQLTIDGYTEPGSSPATASSPAVLRIEVEGSLAGSSANGLNITAGSSTVKGLAINRFSDNGIRLASSSNRIEGNYIGTNVDGTAALGNGSASCGVGCSGILVQGFQTTAANNIVGGTSPAARNVISGNRSAGIWVDSSGATGSTIQGNFIGTDKTGTVDLSLTQEGILLNFAGTNHTIGGSSAGARNLISGNVTGIRVQQGAGSNTIQGNLIGTDVNGTAPLGNSQRGVDVVAAPNNLIGGTTAGAGNVISANNEGIQIVFSQASGNLVRGNLIGTDVTGTSDLGNTSIGVIIFIAPNNVIGGTAAGARNVISGNGVGVHVQGSGAASTLIQGNLIGTDATGGAALGNSFEGVRFTGPPGGSPNNNTVGGTAAGSANTIAFNGGDGVSVQIGTGNAILSNSIFDNGQLGIDLAPDGVTPNDPGDADTGANDLQNFPVLTRVSSDGSSTKIKGTLDSEPNTTYRLEFFSSPTCDPSGHGEGKALLGSTDVTTDGVGHAEFEVTFGSGTPEGQVVTATATDPGNNSSEFSQCATVQGPVGPPATLTLDPKADSNPVGTSHTVEASVKDASDQPVPGISVRFSVVGSVSSSGDCTTDANGRCSFTYDGPTAPGADAISAFADTDGDGSQDLDEPGDVAAKTWVAAAPNTLLLEPLAHENPVGTKHTVTATVEDLFGNPTPGIVVRFAVTGSVSASGNCTTGANGQCDFTYDGPTSPGVDAITAFADIDEDGTRDLNEPEGAATKAWAAGAPATLTLDPPADQNPVGTSHTVTATVRDAFGNLVPRVVVRFAVTGAVTTSGQCTTNDDGVCDFTYDGPTTPGADAIAAFADTDGDGSQGLDEPGAGATKLWLPGPPVSVVLDPPADQNPVGTSHTVTATVRDAFGNPTPGIVVRFSVTGSVAASGDCTTDANGRCSFTYDGPTTPGADAISAFADTDNDGTQDAGEPSGAAEKTWVPGPPSSVVVEPPTATNRAGEEHCVTATVRDAFGNPTPGVKVFFEVTGANSASGTDVTDDQGKARFCYTGTNAGEDVITAVADANENNQADTGEPTGTATKTYTPADPATLTLDPLTDENPVGTQHTVTATVKDAFGNPTPGIVVRFTVTGSVPVSGSCTTNAAGQCDFTYDGPELPGADAITAFADTNNDGDQDLGEPAGAAEKSWVLPVSTPGCEVIITNGGWIIAANGDRASFGGNAKVDADGNVSGQEEYQDHGSIQPMNLHGNVLAVVCGADGTQATVFGKATIDGSGSHFYRIDVRDLGEPGVGSDRYGILVATGYSSGEQVLMGGNVQIRRGD